MKKVKGSVTVIVIPLVPLGGNVVVTVRPGALARAEVGVLRLPGGKGGAAPEAVRFGVLFEFGHILNIPYY